MPKCVICQKPINPRRAHSHAMLGKRKVYGCEPCTKKFDAFLDEHCPACGSEKWYEHHSDGFVWLECDDCQHTQVENRTSA